jgi:hypothetical protein
LCTNISGRRGGGVYALECEYYNATECGGQSNAFLKEGDEDRFCNESQRVITCPVDRTSSTETLACFVMWQRSTANSSREVVQFKGCFISNKDCIGQSSCVDRNYPKSPASKKNGMSNSNSSSSGNNNNTIIKQPAAALTHYCCCDQDNCNREYSWVPNVTTTTPRRKYFVWVGP